MKINPISTTNFKARISRNWDGVGETSKRDTVREFDSAINQLKERKQQVLELDEFMNSDEVKPLLKSLPRKDLVNINNNYCTQPPSLEYITRERKSQDKIFYTTINPKPMFLTLSETRTPDGTLDKKGITEWLVRMNEFFN